MSTGPGLISAASEHHHAQLRSRRRGKKTLAGLRGQQLAGRRGRGREGKGQGGARPSQQGEGGAFTAESWRGLLNGRGGASTRGWGGATTAGRGLHSRKGAGPPQQGGAGPPQQEGGGASTTGAGPCTGKEFVGLKAGVWSGGKRDRECERQREGRRQEGRVSR